MTQPRLLPELPATWARILGDEVNKPYYRELEQFVASERATHSVFPSAQDVFNAFELTPYPDVRVLLLGQDPYHDAGQAHGLCFSVRPPMKPPPSLANMFKELAAEDPAWRKPNHGCLEAWAKQGILMINAVLTVRAHEPASHKKRGWETFTDAVISSVSEKRQPVVFVLWGGYAKKKVKLIDQTRHIVLEGTHPSPLSAANGFFGSHPFGAINRALVTRGQSPIDWTLANL